MFLENFNELIEFVLVVDDSVLQCQYSVLLLQELGVDLIYEVGNGNEVLDLLVLFKLLFGLVVIDLEMLGMDGIELIQ